MMIDPNTRIIDLTVGQLMDLVKNATEQAAAPKHEAKERRLTYGISGIASIFNCSMSTANRIKKSGKINGAIKQSGRTIVVDVELALELFNEQD